MHVTTEVGTFHRLRTTVHVSVFWTDAESVKLNAEVVVVAESAEVG